MTSNADYGAGAAIHRAVIEYMVCRWLDGSNLKADRPTLAELKSCGYIVVKVPPNDGTEAS